MSTSAHLAGVGTLDDDDCRTLDGRNPPPTATQAAAITRRVYQLAAEIRRRRERLVCQFDIDPNDPETW